MPPQSYRLMETLSCMPYPWGLVHSGTHEKTYDQIERLFWQLLKPRVPYWNMQPTFSGPTVRLCSLPWSGMDGYCNICRNFGGTGRLSWLL